MLDSATLWLSKRGLNLMTDFAARPFHFMPRFSLCPPALVALQVLIRVKWTSMLGVRVSMSDGQVQIGRKRQDE